jgi:hypothetical protein
MRRRDRCAFKLQASPTSGTPTVAARQQFAEHQRKLLQRCLPSASPGRCATSQQAHRAVGRLGHARVLEKAFARRRVAGDAFAQFSRHAPAAAAPARPAWLVRALDAIDVQPCFCTVVPLQQLVHEASFSAAGRRSSANWHMSWRTCRLAGPRPSCLSRGHRQTVRCEVARAGGHCAASRNVSRSPPTQVTLERGPGDRAERRQSTRSRRSPARP